MTALRIMWLWVSLAFRATPWLATLLSLNAVVAAALAPLTSLGLAMAIGAATTGSSLWPGLGLAAGVLVVGTILANIAPPAGDTADEKIMIHVAQDIMHMVTGIGSMGHHEDPALADRIGQLRREIWQISGIYRALTFVGTVAGTITVGTLLVSIHPLMLGLLLIALLPTGLNTWFAVLQRRLWKSKEPERRLADKLTELMWTPSASVELRSFGLGPVLLRLSGQAYDEELRPLRRLMVRSAWIVTATSMLAWACYLAALAWLVVRAHDGLASVASVALLVMIAGQIRTTAASIAMNANMVIDALDTFGRYQWLRDYARRHDWSGSTAQPPARLSHGITVEDVSFAYPSDAHNQRTAPSLDRVSLELPAGTTVAFVGDNGAGKSTLVKLLARLYDPTEGRILVDGTPLDEISPDAWRARISAGFQDFARLEFLAVETIGASDLSVDERAPIEEAARHGQADVVIDSLPSGLDTQLGMQFEGGVGLSGGQWQRLALARAMLRKRPLLMLLDEPTAALDPEAEHAIYDRYAAAAREVAQSTGGVTVLVSHRFSTVRMADLIVVLSGGRIVEQGSHAELLAAGGRYAELFHLQADAYR
ncbi:ABC transporter ATP-binding protein [Aestuariimicrobium ganziense]|uniref:ABC transporter ATP-binding protein n=1 Tax=Aestuariimicrobium ganziense TaxID=2773677 RepID=UPI0019423BED|nr:ABC transporter ATP-binding protein [Aestuariimicrobium ganziense]